MGNEDRKPPERRPEHAHPAFWWRMYRDVRHENSRAPISLLTDALDDLKHLLPPDGELDDMVDEVKRLLRAKYSDGRSGKKPPEREALETINLIRRYDLLRAPPTAEAPEGAGLGKEEARRVLAQETGKPAETLRARIREGRKRFGHLEWAAIKPRDDDE